MGGYNLTSVDPLKFQKIDEIKNSEMGLRSNYTCMSSWCSSRKVVSEATLAATINTLPLYMSVKCFVVRVMNFSINNKAPFT